MERLVRWDAQDMGDKDKYELLKEDTKSFGNRTLYRIRALIDFGDVKAGDIGGYIENERNLSQWYYSWVYPGSTVWEYARVSGDAKVRGISRLQGVSEVAGSAEVMDVTLRDGVTIDGHARVANIVLTGNLRVSGEASIKLAKDVVFYSRVGSENGVLTAYKTKDDSVGVNRGCFEGSLGQFEEAVRKTHGVGLFANEYALEYQALISAIKVRFDAKKVNVPGLGNIYLCVDK